LHRKWFPTVGGFAFKLLLGLLACSGRPRDRATDFAAFDVAVEAGRAKQPKEIKAEEAAHSEL
jgi:hypothetical protein